MFANGSQRKDEEAGLTGRRWKSSSRCWDRSTPTSPYSKVGNVYFRRGKDEEALRYFRQALQIQRNAFVDVPDVATSKYNIGVVLKATGMAREASASFAGLKSEESLRWRAHGVASADTADD